ncbi:hypothetical protein F0267_01695 [Vibrio coralliilyticus]|uniref:Uncharacterized protein n=1 Tax=Vibrio coralliilyticus TaxID=190893 RepID=A0AAN0VZZ8_9VIBR|nr:hypothetical protein [Vibrio coralliilyticus]AIW22383.1 hypothetical protein IX92_25265 [Vibrio coralliilyticus]NOH36937.1 hypothetical protein [Vibrio coralliilyticus]
MKIFKYLFLLAFGPVVGQAGEWQQQHFVDPHSQKSTKTYSISGQNAAGKNVIFSFHCDTVVRTFSNQSGPAYLERQGMYDTFSLKLYFPDTDFNLYEPVSVRVGWQPKWKTFRPKSFMPFDHNTLYYRDVFTQYVNPTKGSSAGSYSATLLGKADKITIHIMTASGAINESWVLETPGIQNVVYDMSNVCNAVNGHRVVEDIEASMSVQLRKDRAFLDRQWTEYLSRFDSSQRGTVLLQYNQQQAEEREQRKERIRFFDNQDNWGYPSRY